MTNPTSKTELPVFHPNDASSAFWDIVDSGTSGPSQECMECGRIVFIVDGHDDPGPNAGERYVSDNDNDGVFSAWFVGVHCVYGCPCHAAGRLESRLLNSEEDLAKFVRMRHRQCQKKTESLSVD